jgi:hypothetical protein
MAFTQSPPKFSTSDLNPKWNRDYIIESLPTWVYEQNEEPNSINECRAKISSLKYTIEDIDLQIQIRELEVLNGNSKHSNSYDTQKWKAGALKAKQSYLHLLNAYTYWLLINDKNNSELKDKLKQLINLLIIDPCDIEQQLEKLL